MQVVYGNRAVEEFRLARERLIIDPNGRRYQIFGTGVDVSTSRRKLIFATSVDDGRMHPFLPGTVRYEDGTHPDWEYLHKGFTGG